MADLELAEKKPPDYFVGDRSAFLEWVGGRYRRVLEIGCGAGGNADWYRRNGAESISGIEISPGAAAIAAERFDRVVLGPVETQLDAVDGPFDLIVCGDVLEHLIDPWAIVARLRGLSHRDTVLAISIPNIRYYRAMAKIAFGQGFEYEPSGIFDSTHLRFFTKRNVEDLLTSSGWAPTRWGPDARRGKLLRWVTRGAWYEWRTVQLLVVAKPA